VVVFPWLDGGSRRRGLGERGWRGLLNAVWVGVGEGDRKRWGSTTGCVVARQGQTFDGSRDGTRK